MDTIAEDERKPMAERTDEELLAILGGAWGLERRQEAALVLGARMARLRAALKPFAELARTYRDETGEFRKPDHARVFSVNDTALTVGALRGALKAMEDK